MGVGISRISWGTNKDKIADEIPERIVNNINNRDDAFKTIKSDDVIETIQEYENYTENIKLNIPTEISYASETIMKFLYNDIYNYYNQKYNQELDTKTLTNILLKIKEKLNSTTGATAQYTQYCYESSSSLQD